MKKQINDFFIRTKQKKIRKRYEKISNIKLKDIFLNVNKEDVIKFCIDFLKEDDCYEVIALLIGYEEDEINLCPINDESLLSEKYDYYLDILE